MPTPLDNGTGRPTTFPISEIFGPTLQGEGALCGHQTIFIRFVGCDYRCSWCDTKYAAFQEDIQIEREAGRIQKMAPQDILGQVNYLGKDVGYGFWVTLSGGNPALFNTLPLIQELRRVGFKVAMETQGSVGIHWESLQGVDHLIVSPKPPSSQMKTNWHILKDIVNLRVKGRREDTSLKVVIFNEGDLEFAELVHQEFPAHPLYLSIGTPQGLNQEETRRYILGRIGWLGKKVQEPPYNRTMWDAIILPQLHTLVWGSERGR